MRAGLRFGSILLAGALWLAPMHALAQEATPPATTNTPATDAIGPRELQNFSLPGTTTKPAEQPTQAPAATAPETSAPQRVSREVSAAASRPVVTRSTGTSTPSLAPTTRAPEPQSAGPASPSSEQPASSLVAPPALTTTAVPQPIGPTGPIAPENKLPILPWVLAALALAGGTIFFLWRRRARAALAGVEFDLFSAPEPAPQPPRPSPAPRAAVAPELEPAPRPDPVPKPAPPISSGIVASRLRPSLEIGIQPLRCVVQDDQVAIEFEVDLYNAGTAPARAVLAEASLFNAGANQEQELAAFFASPVGTGNGIDAIPPLKRLTLTSQVVAPRAAIQEYELAGHRSFVPVIAFNARYQWGGGKGQTSAAFLVGRETGGEKVGPLRLDLGPRDVRGLAARSLPTAIRT